MPSSVPPVAEWVRINHVDSVAELIQPCACRSPGLKTHQRLFEDLENGEASGWETISFAMRPDQCLELLMDTLQLTKGKEVLMFLPINDGWTSMSALSGGVLPVGEMGAILTYVRISKGHGVRVRSP